MSKQKNIRDIAPFGRGKKFRLFKRGQGRFYSPQFDALGSYTGSGLDPMDTPEQDSDDL